MWKISLFSQHSKTYADNLTDAELFDYIAECIEKKWSFYVTYGSNGLDEDS